MSVRLEARDLTWAMCGLGVEHVLMQGMAAIVHKEVAPDNEILTLYGTAFDRREAAAECSNVVAYLRACPDFRAGGAIGLINEERTSSVAESDEPRVASIRKVNNDPTAFKSKLLGHMASRLSGSAAAEAAAPAEDADAARGSERAPLKPLRLTIYCEYNHEKGTAAAHNRVNIKSDDIRAKYFKRRDKMLENDPIEIPTLDPFTGKPIKLAYATLDMEDLPSVWRWRNTPKSQLQNVLIGREPVGNEQDKRIAVTIGKFEEYALYGKRWDQKVMLRGLDTDKTTVCYFRLVHFLDYAMGKDNGSFDVGHDGRFVGHAAAGLTVGAMSPWIQWSSGGATQRVPTPEEAEGRLRALLGLTGCVTEEEAGPPLRRRLMAVHPDSGAENESRALLDHNRPMLDRLIDHGWRIAQDLTDLMERLVDWTLERAPRGSGLERAHVRQVFAWYSSDLALQACADFEMGGWMRLVSDVLRSEWEPAVASMLTLPKRETEHTSYVSVVIRNVAALWRLEQYGDDDQPLLAVTNALNRMMLEMLDPRHPASALRPNVETRYVPDKGFGMFAKSLISPTALPPADYVARIQGVASRYAQQPAEALEGLLVEHAGGAHTSRVPAALQHVEKRVAVRRDFQAAFAGVYAVHEHMSVLPLGFMRGVLQRRKQSRDARAQMAPTHRGRLVRPQQHRLIEADWSYEFALPEWTHVPVYRLACTFEFTGPVSMPTSALLCREELLRWAIDSVSRDVPQNVDSVWSEQHDRLMRETTDPTASAYWQFLAVPGAIPTSMPQMDDDDE